jgi:hypothetical protein
MKFAKIILGILILLADIKGLFEAYNQLHRTNVGVIIGFLIICFLAFLLIRSGIKTNRHKGHETQLKSFGWIIVYIIMVIVGLGLIRNIALEYSKPKEFFIISNDIKIPLDNCIKGNIKSLGSYEKAKQTCECLVEKMYVNYIDNPGKMEILKSGNHLERLLSSVTQQDNIIYKYFECFDVEWNDAYRNKFKENMKLLLINTEFQDYYDIDKYCECLLDHFQEISPNKITNDGFFESEIYIKADSICKLYCIK